MTNRIKSQIVLALISALALGGCVGTEEAGDSVPYDPDSDSETEEDNGPLLDYDSDFRTGNDFDFSFEGLPYVGVNLSGPEWGGTPWWPDPQIQRGYVSFPNHFRGWGMTTVRLPFGWERLQPDLQGEFDELYWNRLKTTAYTLRKHGARVLLDVHNYALYRGVAVGDGFSDEDFADLWRRLAEEFKDYPEFIFGLMNEPHGSGPADTTLDDVSTTLWVSAANAAIAAIRETGSKNLIFVSGNGWDGAHSWCSSWTDVDSPPIANSVAMLDIVDPLGEGYLVFEAHQYLDQWSAGRGDCESEYVGAQRLQCFTNWLRDNNKLGFLGEFGVQPDEVCLSALDIMLTYMEENADVWVGWTYWSAGPGCVEWQEADPYCWPDDWTEADIPAQTQVLLDHLENSAVYTAP